MNTTIAFTQYLRPFGTPRPVEIERSVEIADTARRIRERGYTFECEELSSGVVNLTISDGEEDVRMELCANGPDVEAAVDRLITSGSDLPSLNPE